MTARIDGNLRVTGNLTLGGSLIPGLGRSSLVMDSLQRISLPLARFRVHDSLASSLPGTGAADDLGFVGGVFGTDAPSIQTGDLKAAGATTRYARVQAVLPLEYQAGNDVVIRVHGGMITTVADTSATVDVEAYASDDEAGVGSDLCLTAAQSINSLVFGDQDFVLTSSGLSPGDTLDIRLAVAVNDAAAVTAVIGAIGAVSVLADVKG